ncbi:MAG: hypothetical protein Kow0092_36210 [Deferrisomatales bacterium]
MDIPAPRPFPTRLALWALLAAFVAGVLPGLPAGGPAPARAAEVSCTPVNVGVFPSRVHVKCSASFSGVQFFAASTADAAHAARVLSVLSTALAAGRTVNVFYDPGDTSGAAIGCQANDCRLIQGVVFWQ